MDLSSLYTAGFLGPTEIIYRFSSLVAFWRQKDT